MFPLHLLYVFRLCHRSFGFPCESVLRWLWRRVALRPSLQLLIAVSLRVFTVMNLGVVVLVCEIQMLVKQGR